MGYVSTLGVPGLIIGGIYFAVDATIGWDNAFNNMGEITTQTRAIHGSNWNPYKNTRMATMIWKTYKYLYYRLYIWYRKKFGTNDIPEFSAVGIMSLSFWL